jgi:hypothetical protein
MVYPLPESSRIVEPFYSCNICLIGLSYGYRKPPAWKWGVRWTYTEYNDKDFARGLHREEKFFIDYYIFYESGILSIEVSSDDD